LFDTLNGISLRRELEDNIGLIDFDDRYFDGKDAVVRAYLK
jgi:hypothetical protein